MCPLFPRTAPRARVVGYSTRIESPSTTAGFASRGLVAGPLATDPFRLNLLPWHGQVIAPSTIWLTLHPACGHTDDSAPNAPRLGCVTTVSPITTPEPTGTS